MTRALRCLLVPGLIAGAAAAWAQGGKAYAPTAEEQAFLALLNGDGNLLEAREKAKAYLALHPDSFAACVTIGLVHLRADGDLPRSEYFLRRARTMLESAYAAPWDPKGPWRLYAMALSGLGDVMFRMDRHREALRVFEEREQHFIPKWPAQHAWIYMKLGDEKRARQKIAEALAAAEPHEVENGLNTLGALEGESDHPDEAYAASSRLDALTRQPGRSLNSVFLANHGEHAMRLGRLQEAERHYLESSEHFDAWRVTNPWQDLAELYLLEQRIPEALDAVKKMQSWAFRSHPLVGHENWNHRQTIIADLLLHCGYTDEALDLARRVAELPDRRGMNSSDAELWAVGSQLFYHEALLDAAARDEEALSFAPWKARPGLWLQRAQHALAAMSVRRKAAKVLMAHPGWLRDGLRVLAPKNPVITAGGEVLLPRIVGPGLAEAELRKLLSRTGPAAERERGFLWLFLGAARLERGDASGALAALDQAEPALPKEWAEEGAQLQALRAKAFGSRGDAASEWKALQSLMARDPGALRRFGLALPCRIQVSGGALAAKAAGLLEGSPRLRPGRAGYRVVVIEADGGLSGGLDGPNGEVLCRFRVPSGRDADAVLREFCRQFHRKAFGPRIDLSQQQINSLKGSTLSGEDTRDQLKGVLDASGLGTP